MEGASGSAGVGCMSISYSLTYLPYLQALPRRKVIPFRQKWGAEVRGFDFEPPLTEGLADCLRSLLHDYQVLFFRRCRLNHSRLLDIASLLGEPERVHPSNQLCDSSSLADLQSSGSKKTSGYYRVRWQAESSYRQRPLTAMLVYTPEDSADPGEKSFLSNASIAYESLPHAIKQRIETLKAIHRADCQTRTPATDVDEYPLPLDASGVAEHAVLQCHPFTGRRYLAINEAFTHRLVGLPSAESAELLEQLLLQFYRSEHQLKLIWRPASLAIWDPRLVQHYGPPQNDGRRILVRVSSRFHS
jgi:alpha-ketoglutarate-dependent taurine dioxygenase